MENAVYKIPVRVKNFDGKIATEIHYVSERDNIIGESIAIGKTVCYYDSLKDKKAIKDYHIIAE